jgi:hypothetical protein
MKRLFLLATLFVAAFAAPALAQPRVIVRGAHPYYTAPVPFSGFSGSNFAGSSEFIWGDHPLNRYYDPAGRFPDHRYFGPPAVDMILARTLSRNNESMLSHMLRCQAAHATYNPATNFYFGPNGIPRVCYR